MPTSQTPEISQLILTLHRPQDQTQTLKQPFKHYQSCSPCCMTYLHRACWDWPKVGHVGLGLAQSRASRPCPLCRPWGFGSRGTCCSLRAMMQAHDCFTPCSDIHSHHVQLSASCVCWMHACVCDLTGQHADTGNGLAPRISTEHQWDAGQQSEGSSHTV